MSWSAAMTAFSARLTLAAADVSPVISLVRHGEPADFVQDTIAYWADPGTRPSQDGDAQGNSLNLVFVERGVIVKVYLQALARYETGDDTLELRLVAIEEALFTRIWGAWSMGGNVIGLRIEESTYGWESVGDQLTRTVEFTAWLDLPAVASIVS